MIGIPSVDLMETVFKNKSENYSCSLEISKLKVWLYSTTEIISLLERVMTI